MIIGKLFERIKALLSFLGIYLVVGLIISLLCLAAFGKIADSVLEQETLVRIDHELAQSIHTISSWNTTNIFLIVSLFGQQILWGLVAVIVVYYARKQQWWHVAIWLFAMVGGQIMNSLIKSFFQRPRPVFENPFATAQDFSFPSGHSMLSLIVYGLLAYYLCIYFRENWQRILIVFSLGLLVILIGISRMYLGVHFLSDVVGGFAAGGVWLFTCITAAEILRRRLVKEHVHPETSSAPLTN